MVFQYHATLCGVLLRPVCRTLDKVMIVINKNNFCQLGQSKVLSILPPCSTDQSPLHQYNAIFPFIVQTINHNDHLPFYHQEHLFSYGDLGKPKIGGCIYPMMQQKQILGRQLQYTTP